MTIPVQTDDKVDNGEPLTCNDDENHVLVKDKFYLTYILFYTMGTLSLVSDNFFQTANDYWMYKFRDTNVTWNASSDATRNVLQTEFTSVFTIVSNVTAVIGLVLAVILAAKVNWRPRAIGAILALLTAFGITIVFVKINSDTWQEIFFGIVMSTAVILNGASSVFLVTLFELAAKFPSKYIAIVLSGQSICGIFAALVQIISLGVGGSSQVNALIYFGVGALCVIVTLASFATSSRKSNFFKFYVDKSEDLDNKSTMSLESIKRISWKIKFYLVSVIVVYGTSVSIHPGVTSLVVSVDKGNGNQWNDVYFVPVATFLTYYVSDFVGRELSTRIRKPFNDKAQLSCALARIVLVPIIMLCNARPRNNLPNVFNADYYYIIFVIVFAFTNGYFLNLGVMTTQRLLGPEEKELASTIIVVCLVIAVGICSFVNLLFVNVL